MKLVKTIFAFLSIIFALLLWWTRTEDLQSQSEYALSVNSVWYYLMHIAIIFTFISDWVTHPNRYLNWLPAVGSCLIMYFDMFSYKNTHNIVTGITMLAAVINLIVYARNSTERSFVIINCVVGILMFPLGLYTDVRLFFTEVIAEFCVAVGLARRFWVDEN